MCLQSFQHEDDIKYYAELLIGHGRPGDQILGPDEDLELPEEEDQGEFLILPVRHSLPVSELPLEQVWDNPLEGVEVFTFFQLTAAQITLKERMSHILSVDPAFYNPVADRDFEIIRQWLSSGEAIVVNPEDVRFLISNLETGLYANYSLYIAFEKLIAASFCAGITTGRTCDECLNDERKSWFDAMVEQIGADAQALWNLYDAVA